MHRFPNGSVFYRDLERPYSEVVRGEGIYLYDRRGKQYIDGSGGALVVNIGHGRSEVAEAMARQASQVAYTHGSHFTTEVLERLSTKLTKVLPGDLDKVYLVPGGAEAVETSIKLSRQYQLALGRPEKHKVIGRWPSYHGNTLGALAVSGRASLREPYEPLLADLPRVPAPYCYRCPFGEISCAECGVKCADALEQVLDRDPAVAAFIAEPILGAAGGAAIPPPEYFPRVREICDRYGILLIADEVMTGFGRTGRYFGMDHFGVQPDVVVMGKGLSGGYIPAGAVAVRTSLIEAVRERFGNFTHGYTFSHHPVVAAACDAVVSILEREQLPERAWAKGPYFSERLRELEQSPLVGDVRAIGLLAGIELVADRKTKAPFPRSRRLVEEVAEKAFSKGLIVYRSAGCADGVDGDLIMLAPPLIIEEEQIDTLTSVLVETLSEVSP